MPRASSSTQNLDAVLFDVIGTLVDEDRLFTSAARRLAVETGIDEESNLLAGWVASLDRRMDAVVSSAATWEPHRELVRAAAEEAVRGLGGHWSEAAASVVARLDGDYRAWPDVAAATSALRKRFLVAALSNGDLDSLARLANSNSISWDLALSAGSVQTFKPSPEAYRYAIDALQIDPARTLFVASHPWDLRAAAWHGFRTAYVGRPGAEPPGNDDAFDVECSDLSELVQTLDAVDS